jgi:hypothetical protein
LRKRLAKKIATLLSLKTPIAFASLVSMDAPMTTYKLKP